jgi:hypothetical protein
LLNTDEELEAGLGSIGKLRIMRALARRKDEAYTKYALERATGLKPVDMRNDLKTLTQINWVKEHPYRPKKYRINTDNPTVSHLIDFFIKARYV